MSEQSIETGENERGNGIIALTPVRLIEPHSAVPISAGGLTPMDLLNRALSQGAGIEIIEKFMDLQDRHERNQARKAFDAAIADAKQEIPPIIKNRRVFFEAKSAGAKNTDYRHEDLGEIARTVDPILGRFGLSYRWRTKAVPNEPVTVTCILSHRGGHFEENSLSAGRDESGNKNAIQAIGSTVTYLQRYTLKAALGLAASNDDDGQAAGQEVVQGESEFITDVQRRLIEFLIDELKSDVETHERIRKFCAYFKIDGTAKLPAKRFDEAVKMINSRKKA
jgi:hypothetical protein